MQSSVPRIRGIALNLANIRRSFRIMSVEAGLVADSNARSPAGVVEATGDDAPAAVVRPHAASTFGNFYKANFKMSIFLTIRP